VAPYGGGEVVQRQEVPSAFVQVVLLVQALNVLAGHIPIGWSVAHEFESGIVTLQ
jgi:hypothetical protein